MTGLSRIDENIAERTAALDRAFRPALLSYFAKRVGSRSEAEDLTQEVFIRLLKHPDRNTGLTLGAYVFTIAGNLLRDWAKSARAGEERATQSLDLLAAEPAAPSPGLVEDRNPERVLVGKEAVKGVIDALQELDERTRDVFILSRLENMHQREIALMYGISVSMVEKLMMKAIAHLGTRLLRR